MKILFVAMNEYRLWAAPRAAELLARRQPGRFELRVYRVADVNADSALERRLLEDCGWADFAVLASHGSIQALGCFAGVWERLAGKKPVFFTTTMADELAELTPALGMSPAVYSELLAYFQAGTPEDLAQLILCAANACFGGAYPLQPPCQRRCDFVVFRRTGNVEKWRVRVYSLCIIILAVFVRQA